MRSFRHILIFASVVALLLLPILVHAQDDTFYATTNGAANGTGARTDPRRAEDAADLDDACEYFAEEQLEADTGTVYWALIAGDNAVYYQYTLDADTGDCTKVGGIRPGLPPGLGVTLSPPVIVGILIAAGLLLLAGAWFLRSRLPARRAAV